MLCISKLSHHWFNTGLSSLVQYKAIIWTIAGLSLIGPFKKISVNLNQYTRNFIEKKMIKKSCMSFSIFLYENCMWNGGRIACNFHNWYNIEFRRPVAFYLLDNPHNRLWTQLHFFIRMWCETWRLAWSWKYLSPIHNVVYMSKFNQPLDI